MDVLRHSQCRIARFWEAGTSGDEQQPPAQAGGPSRNQGEGGGGQGYPQRGAGAAGPAGPRQRIGR